VVGVQLHTFVGQLRERVVQATVTRMIELVNAGIERASVVHRPDGCHYLVSGSAINLLDKPATLHLRCEIMKGEQMVLSGSLMLYVVPPHTRLPYAFDIVSLQRVEVEGVRVTLHGVS
jgi:hypothetical protein